MTETALNEKIAKLTENELSEAHLRSKDRRRLRRVRDIQKSDRLLHIINYGGYAPHRGYIDWGGTAGRCCTQVSTSNIPGTADAGMFRLRETSIATYLPTGGCCIEDCKLATRTNM